MIVFLGAGLAALILTKYLIAWLEIRKIMALPGKRSCHTSDTPVGGGWVLFGLTFIAWIFFFAPAKDGTAVTLAGMVVLVLVSWLDDKNFVSPALRMALQIVAVAASLWSLQTDTLVFSGFLPFWLDRLVTAFFWLWFINLYNFMDGIDGMAGTETVFICLGLVLVGTITGLASPILFVTVVIAGASTGFLYWNWHPAKIFMGDTGSITMGFVLGWFLIQLASHGYLLAALILPLYFLSDASWTLLSRIYKGEKFWQPHRTHFYQKAAIALKNHGTVVSDVIIANIFLVGAAVWSLSSPVAGLVLACVTVSLLLLRFYSFYRK